MAAELRRWSHAVLLGAAMTVAATTPPRTGRAQVAGDVEVGTAVAPLDARSAASPTAAPPPSFPFLPGEAPGSVSLGDTSTGRLAHAVHLDESEALAILPKQKIRGYRWGTSELVGALSHAAGELHRQTGTQLWVGHLSRRNGGDLPYSVSHNAGRDADIAFCYQDAEGNPVEPDDLIGVMGDGHTVRRGLYFDVGRTWRVIKALITYEGAQIQYLFMSRALEGKLLLHAKARGEPTAIRARAETLIHQPGRGAARHHDHIHLRLYCSREDVLAGCRNTGREHRFAELYRRDRARFAMGLRRHLSSPDADVRRRATERIGLLDAKLLGGEVAARLDDPTLDVRLAALVALARFGDESHLAIARRWLTEQPPSLRQAAGERLARAVEPGAGELLAHLVDQASTDAAPLVDQAGRSRHLSAIPALVRRLGDPDLALRNRAARALGRLTAHRHVADYRPLSGRALEHQRQKWRNAWAAGRTLSRRAWLMRGFHRSGFEVGRLEPEDAWGLVAALSGPEHIAINATEQLEELFEERGDCAFWRGWLTARRNAFELPPAPPRRCR